MYEGSPANFVGENVVGGKCELVWEQSAGDRGNPPESKLIGSLQALPS